MTTPDSNHLPNVALLLQTTSNFEGGVARVVINLANGLAADGLRVDLVTTGCVASRPDDLRPEVRLVELGAQGLKDAFFPLVRYLRKTRPDAVLSSMDHLNILAVWARVLSRVPTRLIVSTHASLTQRLQFRWSWRERFFLPYLISRSYALADGIVGVSKGLATELRQFVPRSTGEIRHIYNPIVSPAVESKIADASPIASFDTQTPVVLGAGRFSTEKDFLMLLEAFALARKQRALKLVLLGDGIQKAELENRAFELGISEDVSFPGMVGNPFPYMQQASVFVVSSHWEGFGNVIVEAMACGTPVVSTDCPSGPAEILDYGKFGTLTPVGDAVAMAAAILETLDNPVAPALLKIRAREFSIENSARQYREVLGL